MVNPLGRRFAKYDAAKSGHDVVLSMKQSLKVAAHFVHGDGQKMKAVFDRAQAKKDAKEAVILARQTLEKEGIYRSHDLDYLGSILKTVAKDRQDRLGDRDFRLALFDRAWKESVGNGSGKLAILLKKSDGASRDGTTALRSDLRSKAKGDWQEFRTAMRLVDMLNDVKKSEDREPLFGIFARSPDALSSSALWQNETVRKEFQCFGLPLSISQLAILAQKKDIEARQNKKPVVITEEEVYGLMKTLKDATDRPDKYYIELTNKIDLTRPRHEVIFQISKVIADHYLEKLDLSQESKEALAHRIESATKTGDVTDALVEAHGKALERTKVAKDQLVEAIGTALTDFLHPERNCAREAMSNDTDAEIDNAQKTRKIGEREQRIADELIPEAKVRMGKVGLKVSEDDFGHRMLLKFARLEARKWGKKVGDDAVWLAVSKEIWGTEKSDTTHARPGNIENDPRWDGVTPRMFRAALKDATELPEMGDHKSLIQLFARHSAVFSGPIWIHENIRIGLNEYYNFGRSLAALRQLSVKSQFTSDDVKFLRNALREPKLLEPANGEAQEAADFANLMDDTKDARELLPSIELGTNQTDNLSKMVNMVADYFIYQARVNMGPDDRKIFHEEFETKSGVLNRLEGLEKVFVSVLKNTSVDRQRFVAPLEDLEALLPETSENGEAETSESLVD
jgi:hypothetical protein